MSGLVEGLRTSGQLADGAVIVYEHASDAGGLSCEGVLLAKSKTHGITTVDLLVARSSEDQHEQ